MSIRKPLICANWKMHQPPLPLGATAGKSPPTGATAYHPHAAVDIVVFPSFLHITKCIEAKLTVGGQCGHPEPEGAFTGDVSMKMLKDTGCQYVLCGHSERRRKHDETDAFIAEQVIAALEAGLQPILCIGETKREHDAGKAHETLKKQLHKFCILHSSFCIAYEPLWAIGTGINALPDDVQEIHACLRSLLPQEAQDSTRILYGGSVNDLNAADFLAHPDIDGLLVGGASLDPAQFSAIVEAALATV